MVINFFVRYFYLVVSSFFLSEQIGNQYHCHQCFLIAASDLTALLVVVMVVPAVVAAVATAALLTLLLLPLKLLFIQSICCVRSINSLCAYYANCWLQKMQAVTFTEEHTFCLSIQHICGLHQRSLFVDLQAFCVQCIKFAFSFHFES